jgi:hypothetical protein
MTSLFNHLLVCLCISNMFFIVSNMAEGLAAIEFLVNYCRGGTIPNFF